ncbi:hypothetical protein JCM10914A_25790 [Paenibacillus sp. JCM 10914]
MKPIEPEDRVSGTGIVLEISPGRIQGAVDAIESASGKYEVSVEVELLIQEARDRIIAYLREDPQALYRLLVGRDASWLEELAPVSLRGKEESAHCTCGRTACAHAATLLDAATLRFAAEPLERLKLLGLPREALLTGVLDAWAMAAPPQAGGPAEESATRGKERGANGPSPGEWVAEAAAEGRLHRPGPQLGEFALALSPPPAGQLGPAGDWAGLLPGVSGAAKALGLIAREAAKQAEQKRRGMEG